MKILKKLLVIAGVAIVAIALLIGGGFFVDRLKFKNVFDEMYYAWIDYPQSYRFAIRPGFWNTIPLAGRPTCDDIQDSVEYDRLLLSYDSDYMKPNTKMFLAVWNKDSENADLVAWYKGSDYVDISVVFAGIVEYSEGEELVLLFIYNVEKKILFFEEIMVETDKILEGLLLFPPLPHEKVERFLKENNITKEEIESYQRYFLYEVAVGSWVEGNGALSKFSKWNPGKFTVVDNTFSDLGEDWH